LILFIWFFLNETMFRGTTSAVFELERCNIKEIRRSSTSVIARIKP
jgi:hypothetical protein